MPLWSKFRIAFSFYFWKLEVQNTYHAKFYRNIRTGSLIILTLFFGFGGPHYSIQKCPRVVKRVGTRLSLSEVTSYSHLDKPTWLILYTACEKSVVFSRKNLHAECLQGIVWCSIVTGWLTKSWEYRFIPLLVRAASMQRGKDLSANTENISIRRDSLAYVPFILPATASLVQCM